MDCLLLLRIESSYKSVDMINPNYSMDKKQNIQEAQVSVLKLTHYCNLLFKKNMYRILFLKIT